MPRHRLHIAVLLCVVIVLAGCASSAEKPAVVATATMGTAPNVQPLTALLSAMQAQHTVTAAGYYFLGHDGAVLVDGLSFSADTPQPLSNAAEQLWLGETPAPADAVSKGYAPVLAQGLLEGPGHYGPAGRFVYQLAGGSLAPLTPIQLTLQALLAKAFVYDGQLVRVSCALLLSTQSALLVERLNDSGIPPAEARQVKLLPPFRDEALRARLPGASGMVRFGPVEVEGFWRGGALLPLSITLRCGPASSCT